LGASFHVELDYINCRNLGGGFNTTPKILECTERERGIFGLQDRLR
jgi:hypothetical protein